jgi:hypothetical protein
VKRKLALAAEAALLTFLAQFEDAMWPTDRQTLRKAVSILRAYSK